MQPIIDAHIPVFNNYKAAGVYHHNSGKTVSGSHEFAIHATGKYPDWWLGIRYRNPIPMLAAGVTNFTTRDIIQKALFGDPMTEDSLGTGTIPKADIGRVNKKAANVNAFDSVSIKHYTDGIFDGWSTIHLRAYEQGNRAFMGPGYVVVWGDEEPPPEIYSQMVRATIAQVNPLIFLTMTPEEGMTQVVAQFVNDLKMGQFVMYLTWDDALHMTPEMKADRLSKFPEHEREMRSKGIPLQGSGLVFSQTLETMLIDPFDIPTHWYRGIGVDFGYNHPFGAGMIAHDRDSDVMYLVAEYRESKTVPAVHASAIKAWGDYPVFWPHDGLNSEKGTGIQLVDKYKDAGLPMFYKKTSNPPPPGKLEGEGGNSVEASLLDMNERMGRGAFKIFRTCRLFQEEYRMYHRALDSKDGRLKIIKMNDDVISAVRYASMMVRHFRNGVVARPQVQHVRKGRRNFGM